jgi:organic hydroperoxide reductase OsmC/OhrA
MKPFPHEYAVTVDGLPDGEVRLRAERLPILTSASPAEFGGPGDRWSPETLLVGAIGDCFILTFRAVARALELPWAALQCDVSGTLDRLDRAAQFTQIRIRASLVVPEGTSEDLARRALEKAERGCLVSNSLKASRQLETVIESIHIPQVA